MAATTYPVTWQNGGDGLHSGKAELGANALHLEGHDDRIAVPYDDLTGISIAHAAGERLAGRPTLVLERKGDTPVRLAGVVQFGIVSELAERLASRRLGRLAARKRMVVVLPIREDAHDDVRRLLDYGPPFDLAETGLRRHQVFLTEREAIFVFDTDDQTDLTRLFNDPGVVWAAAAAWGELASGPARMADEAFSWERA
jgi:hypothetical protein